jgi:1-deoxy-D-xylulose-5-phosphate reductoisomerase
MIRKIAVLGATGSVGKSALDLLEGREERFRISMLSAHQSGKALWDLGKKHKIPFLCWTGLTEPPPTNHQEKTYSPKIHFGPQRLLEALEDCNPDMVLNAITGSAGLRASAWTLEKGKDLLLANKESLVVAGPLLRRLADRSGSLILPVDSEHAAIHQCLCGEARSGKIREGLKKVYLTASGGPFWKSSQKEMNEAQPMDALQHPTWSMGPRISIGSATMMNKAFEILEAHHLFGLKENQIEVLIHRQSIVHSMVEFIDGSLLAQMGIPDMRFPILYCLGFPERLSYERSGFDLPSFSSLSFEQSDPLRFPALRLAQECLKLGGDSGAVLNAADEVATQAFLEGRISFPRILQTVEKVLEQHKTTPIQSIEQVLETDRQTRERTCQSLVSA